MQPTKFSTSQGQNRERIAAQRNLWIAVGVALVIWFIPGLNILIWPLRLFVVIIHEGCHAIMTILSGGQVVSITISPKGSGLTESLGGDPFLILPAGYLGATLFGACSLLLSKKIQSAKSSLMLLGIVVLLIVGLWIHPFNNPIGFLIGICIGIALELLSHYLKPFAASYVLSFLAIELCLNALSEVWLLISITENTNIPNDAVFMSRNYGLPPAFWAVSWAILSLIILWVALRRYWS